MVKKHYISTPPSDRWAVGIFFIFTGLNPLYILFRHLQLYGGIVPGLDWPGGGMLFLTLLVSTAIFNLGMLVRRALPATRARHASGLMALGSLFGLCAAVFIPPNAWIGSIILLFYMTDPGAIHWIAIFLFRNKRSAS